MSQAVSPVSGKPYGLAGVCRVWRLARSGIYRHQSPPPAAPPRRRGPIGAMSDEALTAAIRGILAASPFHGEGHRKVWARTQRACDIRRDLGLRDQRGSASGPVGVQGDLQHHLADRTARISHAEPVPTGTASRRRQGGLDFNPVSQKPRAVQEMTHRLAALIADPRNPLLVMHSVADILRPCMLAIACGYEDADDLDCLRTDPDFKFACGRLPNPDRYSQPTISHRENMPRILSVGAMKRFRMKTSRYSEPQILPILVSD
jgi:hypothetical protein